MSSLKLSAVSSVMSDDTCSDISSIVTVFEVVDKDEKSELENGRRRQIFNICLTIVYVVTMLITLATIRWEDISKKQCVREKHGWFGNGYNDLPNVVLLIIIEFCMSITASYIFGVVFNETVWHLTKCQTINGWIESIVSNKAIRVWYEALWCISFALLSLVWFIPGNIVGYFECLPIGWEIGMNMQFMIVGGYFILIPGMVGMVAVTIITIGYICYMIFYAIGYVGYYISVLIRYVPKLFFEF